MASETHTIEPGDAINDRRGEHAESRESWPASSIRRAAIVRKVVRDFESYAARYNKGRMRMKLQERFAQRRGDGHYAIRFSLRTLQRWISGIHREASFPERRGRKRGPSKPIGAAARSLFCEIRKCRGVSIIAACRVVSIVADRFSPDPDWQWPDARTVYRWLK